MAPANAGKQTANRLAFDLYETLRLSYKGFGSEKPKTHRKFVEFLVQLHSDIAA